MIVLDEDYYYDGTSNDNVSMTCYYDSNDSSDDDIDACIPLGQ